MLLVRLSSIIMVLRRSLMLYCLALAGRPFGRLTIALVRITIYPLLVVRVNHGH